MGIRLYPRTADASVLEQLAEVPAGTMSRLKQVKAMKVCTRKGVDYYHEPGNPQLVPVRAFIDRHFINEREYERMGALVGVMELNSFLLNGWGKFTSAAMDFLRGIGFEEGPSISVCGHLDDPGLVLQLLEAMELDVDYDRNSLVVSAQEITFFHIVDRIPARALGGVYWC